MKRLVIALLLPAVAVGGCVTVDQAVAYGVILDVEPRNGLIWKTPEVWVKTDEASSLRDHYCIDQEDPNRAALILAAQDFAATGQRVELAYYGVLGGWPWRTSSCEDGIITRILAAGAGPTG